MRSYKQRFPIVSLLVLLMALYGLSACGSSDNSTSPAADGDSEVADNDSAGDIGQTVGKALAEEYQKRGWKPEETAAAGITLAPAPLILAAGASAVAVSAAIFRAPQPAAEFRKWMAALG